MIFVTVGTQLPFPRLMRAVQAVKANLATEIVAQTLDDHSYPGIVCHHRLPGEAFDAHCARAQCLVGHAGIGTYLAAQKHGLPLIWMPRRKRFSEHRSDHQLDTCEALGQRPGVQIVHDVQGLEQALRRVQVPVSSDNRCRDAFLAELSGLLA